MLVKQVPWCL